MRFSASINFLFTELPFVERFQAASDAGFAGVEIQILPKIDIRTLARASKDAGMKVVLLNIGMGDLLDGGLGLSGVPGREREFAAALDRAIEAADLLDARHLHVGPSRIPEHENRDACLAAYRSNLGLAVSRLAPLAGRTQLVIEAMNRVDMPDALLVSNAQVMEILDENPGVGLLFDIYHVAMNGADVLEDFSRHRGRVCHIQYSDIPGRREPGSGSLDIDTLIKGLTERGYHGWFGAEYRPSVETTATLAWLDRHSNTSKLF